MGAHPWLPTARLGDDDCHRTLLHAATDWPGHFPNGPIVVAWLIRAGADVNARSLFSSHTETALHWAASSGDVAVLDALLDAGADIDAPGAVLGGGTALADACGFGNWAAARRLVERGASTRLKDAAALGLLDRVASFFEGATTPDPGDVTGLSGALAMADNASPPSSCSVMAPTSTGSAGTTSRRSTWPSRTTGASCLSGYATKARSTPTSWT